MLKFTLLSPKDNPSVVTAPVKVAPDSRAAVLGIEYRGVFPFTVIAPVKVEPVNLAQVERSVSVVFQTVELSTSAFNIVVVRVEGVTPILKFILFNLGIIQLW